MDKYERDLAIDERIAIEVYGYQWLSFVDIPEKGTPGYPNKCRVRQFFSPKQLEHPRWKAFLAERESAVADGSEPLSYAYCSSQPNTGDLPEVAPMMRHRDFIELLTKVMKDPQALRAFAIVAEMKSRGR